MNVLITGHTRGIGAALTDHYLHTGATVYGVARGRRDVASTALHQSQADFAAPEDIAAVLTALLPSELTLDVAFLNAGVLGPIAPLSTTSVSTLRDVMDINVWANKVVIDGLIQRAPPRQLILVSSGAGVRGHFGWGAYALSKAALNMLAQLYAHEMPDTHITALAPGLVDTAMQARLRRVDAEKFPSVQRLHDAAGTDAMPDAAVAAARMVDALATLRDGPSGQFVDLRNLPG